MKMYNPPHPGEIIKGLWLDPLGVSITDAAQAMGVSRKTLSKIVNGKARVTPEIAVRLSVALGSSAESWLGHQAAYDLWEIEQLEGSMASNNTTPGDSPEQALLNATRMDWLSGEDIDNLATRRELAAASIAALGDFWDSDCDLEWQDFQP